MKIGVMVESFREGLEGGLRAAAAVGANGVQMYATGAETHPDKLTVAARRALLKKVRNLGLEFSAICADFGHGFGDAAANPRLVADSKKIVDLTVDLECRVVTTHIGVVPSERAHPRYAVMRAACAELARYGASRGVTFAIETGPEPAGVLRAFLDDIAEPRGLGVNFDPANLVMVCREDIPAAVDLLGAAIVHTHAKDGLNLQPVDAEQLYGGALDWGAYIREVPLGEGGVDWPGYLAALRRVGYDGYLTIEREVGENPRRDIELAVGFLRKRLS